MLSPADTNACACGFAPRRADAPDRAWCLGFGATGPWSPWRSYGPTIEAASSIEARAGYADGEPLRLGIDHLGFQVDDVDATVALINGLGGKPSTDRTEVHRTDPSRPQSYYEIKCLGPDEQVIDVSNSGWVGTD